VSSRTLAVALVTTAAWLPVAGRSADSSLGPLILRLDAGAEADAGEGRQPLTP